MKLIGCIQSSQMFSSSFREDEKAIDFTWRHDLTDSDLKEIDEDVQHLVLFKCEDITDRGLRYVGQCFRLKTLDLTGCVKVTDEGIAYLASCKELYALRLASCSGAIIGPALSLLEQLTCLILTECKITKWEYLGELIQLEKLEFDSEGCEDYSFVKKLVNLNELKINPGKFDYPLLDLSELNRLELLFAFNCKIVLPDSRVCLKRMHIYDCILSIQEFEKMCGCEELTELSAEDLFITNHDADESIIPFKDIMFEQLARGLPKLKELALKSYRGIDYTQLEGVGSGNLEKLFVKESEPHLQGIDRLINLTNLHITKICNIEGQKDPVFNDSVIEKIIQLAHLESLTLIGVSVSKENKIKLETFGIKVDILNEN